MGLGEAATKRTPTAQAPGLSKSHFPIVAGATAVVFLCLTAQGALAAPRAGDGPGMGQNDDVGDSEIDGLRKMNRGQRAERQKTNARKEITKLEPLALECARGERPERDAYIIYTRMDSYYRILNSYGGFGPEDEKRLVEIREKVNEIASRHPDWPSMADRRLSHEIASNTHETSKPSPKPDMRFSPKDRRPLEFLNDAKYLAVQFQFRIEFYNLSGSSLVENQGGAITLKDPRGTAMDWSQLHQRSQMTFKRRFRVKSQHGVSHALVCTDALHSWYQADSTEEESALSHESAQSNNAIPWVNTSGQHGDFCGVVDFSGHVLFKFPLAQRTGGDLLMPLAIREDGAAAVLVGESVKRETGEGAVDAVGKYKEVLVWAPSKTLRRVQIDPKASNEVQLRLQFRENKL